ncbi:MAG: ABC transporter permease [Anaerovoracaceae bacterium]|jgi:ABC-2 type transport system permease protein
MFRHNFFYSMKILFRSRSLIFWTFAFPIILSFFFNLAFSNLDESLSFHPVNIAVVKSSSVSQNNLSDAEIFEQALASLGEKGDKDRTFNIRYTTQEKASKLLKDETIAGYVVSGEKPKIYIASNGVDQTILKSVCDEIIVDTDIVKTIGSRRIREAAANGRIRSRADAEAVYRKASKEVLNADSGIVDTGREHMNLAMVEFYTMMAMVCLYGGTIGLESIKKHLANMNPQGKRTSISRASKLTLVLSSSLAAWLVQLLSLAVLYAFMVIVLGVDFGSHTGRVLALTVAGSLTGLTFGTAVGSVLKISDSAKDTFIVMLTMLGCFFAGMMGGDFKYLFDQKIPLLNQVNPAAMLTDGYYSLYYYSGFTRYDHDLMSLVIVTVILLAISIFALRRQRYDSV